MSEDALIENMMPWHHSGFHVHIGFSISASSTIGMSLVGPTSIAHGMAAILSATDTIGFSETHFTIYESTGGFYLKVTTDHEGRPPHTVVCLFHNNEASVTD